jgi:hypothetical protein
MIDDRIDKGPENGEHFPWAFMIGFIVIAIIIGRLFL